MNIHIEGNISSGKSTLLDELKKSQVLKDNNFIFVDEQLNIWTQKINNKSIINFCREDKQLWHYVLEAYELLGELDSDNWIKPVENKSIFELYYEQKKDYALIFQLFVLSTQKMDFDNIKLKYKDKMILSERSFLSSHLFAKMLFDTNYINEKEWDVYNKIYNEINKQQELYIYVKTSSEECYKRFMKRAREGEKIDIKLLETLEKYHGDYFNNNKNVFIINGNDAYIESIVEKILNFYREKIKN